MSALISSVEHALVVAASDTVKVAKFVDTQVLPALKKAQAEASTIEAVTSLVSPPGCQHRARGIRGPRGCDQSTRRCRPAVGASGLNVSLDAQLIADIKSIASAVKGAVSVSGA